MSLHFVLVGKGLRDLFQSKRLNLKKISPNFFYSSKDKILIHCYTYVEHLCITFLQLMLHLAFWRKY